MSKSVLLDTCFLISFVDDSRPNHEKAVKYFKYFIDEGISMYLSSIVCSEFTIKQEINDLPLDSLKMISYNIPDSYTSSNIYKALMTNRSDSSCRNCVKDDLKLTGLCEFNKIDFLITEDDRFYDKLLKLKREKMISFKPLYIPHGFEKSFNIPPTLFHQTTEESKG